MSSKAYNPPPSTWESRERTDEAKHSGKVPKRPPPPPAPPPPRERRIK